MTRKNEKTLKLLLGTLGAIYYVSRATEPNCGTQCRQALRPIAKTSARLISDALTKPRRTY